MRRSPLALAMLLALYGGSAFAETPQATEAPTSPTPAAAQDAPADAAASTDGKPAPDAKAAPAPKADEPAFYSDVTDFDREQTGGKKSALAGALYEEDQLRALRDIMRSNDKQRIKRDVVEKKAPMSPDEITALRQRLADIDEATNRRLSGEPNFKVRNITYNPDSNTPIVISTIGGYAAQVEFYDSTGAPWPISDDGVVGDKTAFTRQIIGSNKHIASFVMGRDYSDSNAAVVLEGLPASIPVILKGTRTTVDGRITVTIPKLGPKADIQPVFQHEINNVSNELIEMQGGRKPANSRTLTINGVPGSESWYDGQFLYLALPGRLLLPPPVESSMTPTGKFLYKVHPTPYISVSVDGVRMSGSVEGVYQTQIRRAKTVFDEENAK